MVTWGKFHAVVGVGGDIRRHILKFIRPTVNPLLQSFLSMKNKKQQKNQKPCDRMWQVLYLVVVADA